MTDGKRREQIEIDVAALAPAVPGEARRILSLGEAKWGKVMGLPHLDRLRRAREILASRGWDTRDTVLACYSAAGFDPGLETASSQGKIQTIGLRELYSADGSEHGSPKHDQRHKQSRT